MVMRLPLSLRGHNDRVRQRSHAGHAPPALAFDTAGRARQPGGRSPRAKEARDGVLVARRAVRHAPPGLGHGRRLHGALVRQGRLHHEPGHSFNDYRQASNMGGDFVIFSDVLPLSLPNGPFEISL